MTATPTPIKSVCAEIIAEADAIGKYTDDIELVKEGDPKVTSTFEEIRLDELEHIQKLVITLTELLSVSEEGGEGTE